MNAAFDDVLRADAATRMGLFSATAQRLGTTPQNVEKDFWVCWTLDALFNGIEDGPRLLFKGGTSLSKGFGLIERFSEDIDVTVFRDDLGVPATVEELAVLSRKKREASLDQIKAACEAHVHGPMMARLADICADACARTGLEPRSIRVEPDLADRQTLRVVYPSITPEDVYIAKSVKIESGAKSALDPHSVRTIAPYVDADAIALDLSVPGITIVDAERTFWDKVLILHGLRRWFDNRGQLRGDGQRVSRHYYDLFRLIQSKVAEAALANRALGKDCVAHARLFFNRPDFDLASAQAPTYSLLPKGAMIDGLRQDYRAMSTMIFGKPPDFDAVMKAIAGIEETVNASPQEIKGTSR